MKDTLIQKDFDDFCTDHGITLQGLIILLNKTNAECMQMSTDDHERFCMLYDDVFKPSSNTKTKGNKLEDLIEVLFVNAFPNIFNVKRNCRTSTNEIDLLINWTQLANNIGLTNEFSGLGNTFLCECKNYDGKVDVTYIGKFSSLLSCSDTKLGVLVAWQGVTGTGWSAGSGLIKKIALAEKRYIIVITKKDLYDIYQKKINLFELLNCKYRALKQDISYEKCITKHELEDEWTFIGDPEFTSDHDE